MTMIDEGVYGHYRLIIAVRLCLGVDLERLTHRALSVAASHRSLVEWSAGRRHHYIHLYSPKLVAIQQTNYKHNTMKKKKKNN